jgi:hypothetical protein
LSLVLWDVMLLSSVDRYQWFRRTCCLHLQCRRQGLHISPKHWYLLPNYVASVLTLTTITATNVNLVNKANLVHNFSYYVYFLSLQVSGDYVPIIRRNDCIYATLGICHSVWMTVCYAGWNEFHLAYRYIYFSWWLAHSRLKTIEKIK